MTAESWGFVCLCARTGDTDHGERGGRGSVSGAFPQVGRRRVAGEETGRRTLRDSKNHFRNVKSGWNSACSLVLVAGIRNNLHQRLVSDCTASIFNRRLWPRQVHRASLLGFSVHHLSSHPILLFAALRRIAEFFSSISNRRRPSTLLSALLTWSTLLFLHHILPSQTKVFLSIS